MPRHDKNERGAALIGAVAIILILSMLGTVSLNVAAQEVEGMAAAHDEARARHLAEAGADLVMQWFHDPASAPAGSGRALFAMRQTGADGPSFFDAEGRSQFAGTAARPDLVFDAGSAADDRLLNDPSGGWLRALRSLGRVTRLAVYGPTTPGLLCTVEVTAEARKLTRTLVVQLGANPLPPIRAGAQIGQSSPVQAGPEPLPLSVHWGDLVVNGDVRLGAVRDVPVKTDFAPVTGQAYAEMAHREDRWLDLLIGGEALFASQPDKPEPAPANVQVRQNPSPGLHMDRWPYQVLKDIARRGGTYYARGQDGLLYRDGLIEPGLGLAAADALRSGAVGDALGLVFVDTLDQAPPRPDNLGMLILNADYLEGIFVINAHVRIAPDGTGNSVPVDSPSRDGHDPPVQLVGINLRGALVTPGNLTLERAARASGAMLIGGVIERADGTDAHLEIWYEDDFQEGLFRGVPLVRQGPMTWLEKPAGKGT